jgi:hypothetical protein
MDECNDGKGDNGKAYDKKQQQIVGNVYIRVAVGSARGKNNI